MKRIIPAVMTAIIFGACSANQSANKVITEDKTSKPAGVTYREISPAEKDELLKARDKVWRDIFTNNREALEKSLPPGSMAINPDGEGTEGRFVDRAKMLADAERFVKSGGKLLKLEFPRTDIQAFGNVAIIYTTYVLETEFGGKASTLKGHATEVFVKTNGEWTNPGWHLDNY